MHISAAITSYWSQIGSEREKVDSWFEGVFGFSKLSIVLKCSFEGTDFLMSHLHNLSKLITESNAGASVSYQKNVKPL